MGSYKLYSAAEIAQLGAEEFNQWLRFLYKNPTKPERSTFSDSASNLDWLDELKAHEIETPSQDNKAEVLNRSSRLLYKNPRKPETPTFTISNSVCQPSSNWLNECWCETQAHSRANFFNIRSQYEDKILNAAKSKNKKEIVRLLSLGSGGLFQDLMIILKLYYNGYQNIELDCIEIENNRIQQSILQAIINRLNDNGANIRVRHFKNMEERGAQILPCDVVYAIDFDDIGSALFRDFSSRQLPGRSRNKVNDSICPLFLGAYAELQPSSSLFLLTYGKNYIAHNQGKVELYCNEFDHQFEERIEPHAYHDYYYINAGILSLLTHLPFLKDKKKPLLINKAILNPSSTSSLEKILTKHSMNYYIASELDIGKKLDEECASVLIIDDTVHLGGEQETYIHSIFEHGHAQISRVEKKSSKMEVFFAFNAIKAAQLSQKINALPIKTYLERANAGIENYLQWRAENASGTRGLTRFSHWYHGDSGIHRAQFLQHIIVKSANLADEELHNLKSTIREKLQDSSNAHHSLARFVYAALAEDREIETLPDSEYKTIRRGLV